MKREERNYHERRPRLNSGSPEKSEPTGNVSHPLSNKLADMQRKAKAEAEAKEAESKPTVDNDFVEQEISNEAKPQFKDWYEIEKYYSKSLSEIRRKVALVMEDDFSWCDEPVDEKKK
jgi:hypothetical protein